MLLQLNSANEQNRELPQVTKSKWSSPSDIATKRVHLDIDHSSKGNVTAECDATPTVTTVSSDPDRPESVTVYHNCELTYQIGK